MIYTVSHQPVSRFVESRPDVEAGMSAVATRTWAVNPGRTGQRPGQATRLRQAASQLADGCAVAAVSFRAAAGPTGGQRRGGQERLARWSLGAGESRFALQPERPSAQHAQCPQPARHADRTKG
jgi:hypothetical protein